ncbi:MAG: GH3 auxin-responsive promoter family protein [Isosphaeraceae bacterium]
MDTLVDASEGWSSLARRGSVRSLVNLGFHLGARLRTAALADADAVAMQARTLRNLVHRARKTRFGRDHRFARIDSVADFQAAVPLRTYESLWTDYLRDQYPVFRDLTWPGLIPFLALTSGTTQGATKYIPVSAEMVASNRKAALTMLAFHGRAYPESRLFHGRLFFLGGSVELGQPAPGVFEGDLSGIAAVQLAPYLRPYTFPPLELALEPNWDRKLSRFAEQSRREPITLVGGVPSWLLMLFQRLLDQSGKATIAEVWPELEIVVHGGVKFDPYREAFRSILGSPRIRLLETYVCSEGFVAFGDPRTELLRLVYDHGVFFEFIPVGELDSVRPMRHWLGNVERGVNYAVIVSTCAGMWAHVIGDTVRFESVDPPLLTFTGRTRQTLSAFGEHLINEELEGAVACAATATGASVRDWHVGPIFEGSLGYHQYVVEFLVEPTDERRFRDLLDAELSRRNADYQAHRAPGVGLPPPALRVARPGVFEGWMRRRGKLGGQNKVPRVDNSGTLTRDLLEYLDETHQSGVSVPAGNMSVEVALESAPAPSLG